MKFKSNLFLAVAVGITCSITYSACQKKKEIDAETQSVEDNALCEQQFMSIQPIVNEKGINEKGIRKTTSCGTWTILGAIGTASHSASPADTADTDSDGRFDNGPVTFQLDFGTTGCLGLDGITRSGKLNITTAKRWSLFNHQVIVDLIGYKANGIDFAGQLRFTKSNASTFTTEVINGSCWTTDWHIDYNCTKTVTLNNNSTPADDTDDILIFSGSSSGKSREGRTFKTNITDPLVKKSNCRYISSGKLELTPDGLKTRTVNFGNGACDDKATFSVNDKSIEFKLQ